MHDISLRHCIAPEDFESEDWPGLEDEELGELDELDELDVEELLD